MNGQSGNDPASQEAQLALLLNAAGQNSLMGLTGAAGGRFGVPDASLEEQILQRASALRTEALMAQQQRQRGLGAGLSVAALQQQQHLLHQQQQLSALAGMSPSLGALGSQEQEAILARAAALRELGIAGIPGGLHGAGGMDRLQQLELVRLEELERRRKQIAALTGLGGGASSELGVEGAKSGASDIAIADKAKEMFRKKQEDLRKTPGTVIVPCRARGMPMDHNFKTAYFVISEDAKHGEDLVCSYFACRNGGVKFRYCAHCMAPVAKRNFCRRHDHGISKSGDTNDEDSELSADKTESSAAKDMICKKVPEEMTSGKEGTSSPLDVLTKAVNTKLLPQDQGIEATLGKRKNPPEEVEGVKEVKEVQGERDEGLDGISPKRMKLWTSLLTSRPRTKDPRHLSSWLNEVLTVSDFETPLEEIDSALPKVIPGGSHSPPPKKIKIEPSESVKESEEKNTEMSDTNLSKESTLSPSKKESGDDFAGSFADWRDRKKEKALNKVVPESLRN